MTQLELLQTKQKYKYYKKCAHCEGIYNIYNFYDKSNRCKRCCIHLAYINRKDRRKLGIPYHSKKDNEKRRLQRKINKANSLGLSLSDYENYLFEKQKHQNNKIILKKIIKRLYFWKKNINHYNIYMTKYKISETKMLEYIKDNPKKSTLRHRILYNHDETYNLNCRLRNQIIKNKKKYPNLDNRIRKCLVSNEKSKYYNFLGYKISDLKEHLQSKFSEGMNWQLFKEGKIHIDHIKPQSLFDLTKDSEIKKCWSLENLQPLWAKDNLSKRNKY